MRNERLIKAVHVPELLDELRTRLVAVAVLIAFLAVPSHAGINTWTPSLPMPTSPWGQGSAVAIDPTDPAIAFAATTAGVFKTTDRGEHWTLVDAFPNASAIAIDPRIGATVIAGNSDRQGLRSQLRRSEDGGATWQSVHTFEWEPSVGALTFDRLEAATVYAALSETGIGKSVDGGKTWTISDSRNGLPCCNPDYWLTLDVASGGVTSPTIYAASSLLYSSTDGAKSWQPIDLPRFAQSARPFEPWTVSVDPSDPARLYVTGYFQPHNGAAAFTSGDEGKQWHRLPLTTTYRITVDPRVPTTLYSSVSQPGGPARGVLRSTDRGETWTEFNAGLTNLDVTSVVVDRTGTLLYANTTAGVFVYEVRSAADAFQRLPDDPLRLPRLIDQLLADVGGVTGGASTAASASAFILPVTGKVRGSRGTVFTTDVTLSNGRSAEQDVVVAWLPQGNASGPAVAMFRATLPPVSGDGGGTLTLADLADDLRLEGLGSMIVFAIDSAGNVDGAAEIDGFARVRSASSCSSGSVSQSLPAVSSQAFGAQRRSRALGLRHEPAYRTNVGIVNLGDVGRAFTIVVDGQRHSERYTVSVPAFSLLQTPLPDRDYGDVALTVISEGDLGAPWVAYGSSVDNASGDSWASVAKPLRD